MSSSPKYVTAQEVADRFSLTRSAVYGAVRQGVIPCYRLGQRMRFLLHEVEAALKREPASAPRTAKPADPDPTSP